MTTGEGREATKDDLQGLLRTLGWFVRRAGGQVEVSRQTLEEAEGMLMIQGTGKGITLTWVPTHVEGQA